MTYVSSLGKLMKMTFDESSFSEEYLQFNAAQTILILNNYFNCTDVKDQDLLLKLCFPWICFRV